MERWILLLKINYYGVCRTHIERMERVTTGVREIRTQRYFDLLLDFSVSDMHLPLCLCIRHLGRGSATLCTPKSILRALLLNGFSLGAIFRS